MYYFSLIFFTDFPKASRDRSIFVKSFLTPDRVLKSGVKSKTFFARSSAKASLATAFPTDLLAFPRPGYPLGVIYMGLL
jgi:hypothetical protein